MIRKGQVLRGEEVTGRWQVRHCQRNETRAPRRAKANCHVLLVEPSKAAVQNYFLMRFSWLFAWETWGVMTLCCFWKYIPACQRKTQPEDWQLAVLGSRLGSKRSSSGVTLLQSVPPRCRKGLSSWLMPAFYLNISSASMKHSSNDRFQMKMLNYMV